MPFFKAHEHVCEVYTFVLFKVDLFKTNKKHCVTQI